MNGLPLLKNALKSHGASITSPRCTVFHALSVQHAPVSVQELASVCPGVDQASVYRTVKLFEESGIIVRILSGSQSRVELSDLFSPHHHHIACTVCGKIVSLHEDTVLEKMINSLGAQYKFSKIHHSLEMEGVCENCVKKRRLEIV